MKTVTPLDLRRSLGHILDEASAGERILIERDRRPLAVLVSVEDAQRLEEDPAEAQGRRDAAFAALEEWRERVLADRHHDPNRPTAAQLIRADRDERDARDKSRIPERLREAQDQ